MKNKFKIISLFSGAGGLDLGFHKAGFETIWANEFDKTIWDTFEYNFPNVFLDKRSITSIDSSEIPDSIGIVGGPPCQSWSEAGSGKGIKDERGKLFLEYIRVLRNKKPLFFLAENVAGILFERHKKAFSSILEEFESVGYNVSYFLLNAKDYGVPQDRKRVIIVGYRKDMGIDFLLPQIDTKEKTLKEAIENLGEAVPAKEKNHSHRGESLPFQNHEYMHGGFSTIFMSRNRVRSWDEPSFTIQAGGRHTPIHPQAPKMKLVGKDKCIFVPGKEDLYRRLSVHECARIQTFPDDFLFKYEKISDGYKMVGNAVPVELAKCIDKKIYQDLSFCIFSKNIDAIGENKKLTWEYR